MCRNLSENSCFGAAYVEKNSRPSHLTAAYGLQQPQRPEPLLQALGELLPVRGTDFGRGEAKAPVEQPNLLQAHERGERSAVWLQGYWGIAEREKAFETFLFVRCICSCEELGGLLNGVIREERGDPSEPVTAQISVLRIKISE